MNLFSFCLLDTLRQTVCFWYCWHKIKPFFSHTTVSHYDTEPLKSKTMRYETSATIESLVHVVFSLQLKKCSMYSFSVIGHVQVSSLWLLSGQSWDLRRCLATRFESRVDTTNFFITCEVPCCRRLLNPLIPNLSFQLAFANY